MLKNPYDADAHLCGQGRLCPQRIRIHNLPDFIERWIVFSSIASEVMNFKF
jgi:hypothetical protein